MKAFSLDLVLRQRQRATQKWPIAMTGRFHDVITDVDLDVSTPHCWFLSTRHASLCVLLWLFGLFGGF